MSCLDRRHFKRTNADASTCTGPDSGLLGLLQNVKHPSPSAIWNICPNLLRTPTSRSRRYFRRMLRKGNRLSGNGGGKAISAGCMEAGGGPIAGLFANGLSRAAASSDTIWAGTADCPTTTMVPSVCPGTAKGALGGIVSTEYPGAAKGSTQDICATGSAGTAMRALGGAGTAWLPTSACEGSSTSIETGSSDVGSGRGGGGES